MDINALLVHPQDNVAVAIKAIKTGERIVGVAHDALIAVADVPKNHKVALVLIPAGGRIVKYGETIGVATTEIKPGDWVHTHNLKAEE
jgi:altronate dehydratase